MTSMVRKFILFFLILFILFDFFGRFDRELPPWYQIQILNKYSISIIFSVLPGSSFLRFFTSHLSFPFIPPVSVGESASDGRDIIITKIASTKIWVLRKLEGAVTKIVNHLKFVVSFARNFLTISLEKKKKKKGTWFTLP